MSFGTRTAVALAALITSVPLAACGGGDDSQMRPTLTDDGCTYRGDETAAAGRFTIEVENQTGHGASFSLERLAKEITTDDLEPYRGRGCRA